MMFEVLDQWATHWKAPILLRNPSATEFLFPPEMRFAMVWYPQGIAGLPRQLRNAENLAQVG